MGFLSSQPYQGLRNYRVSRTGFSLPVLYSEPDPCLGPDRARWRLVDGGFGESGETSLKFVIDWCVWGCGGIVSLVNLDLDHLSGLWVY